jgi:chaperonin GroES
MESTENKVKERPNLRLLADRVLVRLLVPEEQKTKSGIILVATAGNDAKTDQGEVLRVSKRIENLDGTADNVDGWDKVEEGDIVLFSSFAGSKIHYKGREYQILRITDLFAITEPEDN